MMNYESVALGDQRHFKFISGLWTGDRGPLEHAAVLRSTNFRGDGFFDYNNIAELQVRTDQLSTRKLERGDIVIERSGGGPKQPVGRVAVFDPPDNRTYATSNFTTALRVIDHSAFDPHFVNFFLHSLYLAGETESLQRATTGIRNLDWAEYQAFTVPKPPLDEQRSVAKLLLQAYRGTVVNDRQLEFLADLKRAATRALFTKGLRGEAQKDTEIGPVPESWEVSALRRYFDVKHGFAFDGEYFRATGEFTLLTPGHFQEEGGFRDQGNKTKYFTGAFDPQYLLKAGDLLIAMTEQKAGLLGSAAFVPAEGRHLHNQRLGLVTKLNTSSLDLRYLYHLLNSEPVRLEISRTATGSKVKHTSPDRLRDVVAPVPELTEQTEIAEVLDAIDRKIGLHKRKRAVLDELFKALLHKLMTGEIRVANLDLLALDTDQPEGAAAWAT